MISSTMVGTGHFLPRILSNQPGCVSLRYDYVRSKTGGLCRVGERQERQLEGVGTEPLRLFSLRSIRRRREEAPELLLASNLGAPAPPGCNGALAPLRRAWKAHHLPSTDDLQASTPPRVEIEIDQQTSSASLHQLRSQA